MTMIYAPPSGSVLRGPLAALTLVIAVLLNVMLPGDAAAQINPFGGYKEKPLTAEDLQLMNAAASKLREDEATPIGAIERWSNPSTGNSGSVTLLQRFRKRDMPCQRIRHDYRNESRGGDSVFDIEVCRLASGEWKSGF